MTGEVSPENCIVPTDINLGIYAALQNGYSILLFLAVFYRVCHMFFNLNVHSRNWFTITMYSIIIVDLLIGCLVLVTVVGQDGVYDSVTRQGVPILTKVMHLLLKILYAVIILEQPFAWVMYIKIIRVQSRSNYRDLINV